MEEQRVPIRRDRRGDVEPVAGSQSFQSAAAVSKLPVERTRSVFARCENDAFTIWRPHGRFVRRTVKREPRQSVAHQIEQPDLRVNLCRNAAAVRRYPRKVVGTLRRSYRLFSPLSRDPREHPLCCGCDVGWDVGQGPIAGHTELRHRTADNRISYSLDKWYWSALNGQPSDIKCNSEQNPSTRIHQVTGLDVAGISASAQKDLALMGIQGLRDNVCGILPAGIRIRR